MPWHSTMTDTKTEISFFKSGRLRDGGCENLEWQIQAPDRYERLHKKSFSQDVTNSDIADANEATNIIVDSDDEEEIYIIQFLVLLSLYSFVLKGISGLLKKIRTFPFQVAPPISNIPEILEI